MERSMVFVFLLRMEYHSCHVTKRCINENILCSNAAPYNVTTWLFYCNKRRVDKDKISEQKLSFMRVLDAVAYVPLSRTTPRTRASAALTPFEGGSSTQLHFDASLEDADLHLVLPEGISI